MPKGVPSISKPIHRYSSTWMLREDLGCRGQIDLFGREENEWSEEDKDLLRAICGGCPVLETCRAYGAREKAGVWGGTFPSERGFTIAGRYSYPDTHKNRKSPKDTEAA